MEDNNPLKDILLPKTNENEDLETISEQTLMPLFDVTRFEFCTRDRRDKGIDITFDTKKDGSHLGFRFIIQLKATNTIKPNTDGSLSKSIDTSNINFLLHNNHPAYYILHDQSTNTFYYEKLHEFIKDLQNKPENWELAGSHTLRFSKKLTAETIDLMYKEVIEWGTNQRHLQLQTIYIASGLNTNDRVSIDSDFNAVSDQEIRTYIEQFGFQMINVGQWVEVLDLNSKATGNVGSSALYNLILGVASYYTGNRWEALSYLKRAKNDSTRLNEEQQLQLQYFDATVRFSCEIISPTEYGSLLEKLEQSKSIGLYIKLFRAKQNYLESITDYEIGQFELFKHQINEIINDDNAHDAVILTAKCELILYQGFENNYNYLNGITRLNMFEEAIGVNLQDRIDSAKRFMEINHEWYSFVSEVTNEAKNRKHHFAYFTAVINEVIVSFQFLIYTTLFRVLKKIPGISNEEPEDNTTSIEIKLTNITDAINFFKQIGHVENMIVANATKYEILRFADRNDEADEVMTELETLVSQNDFTDYNDRIHHLKNGGCTHEVFQKQLNVISARVAAAKLEHETLIRGMREIDEKENSIEKIAISDNYYITLFPIGEFTFPKSEKSKVFEILNVSETHVIENFEMMFDMGILPVANIYNDSISQEGPAGGNLADKGIQSWRNIHRIRKAFFENGFYRHEIY